jgi:hypothetical protein
MQIIWDKQAADNLRKTHTLLELETFDVKGVPYKTWCVIPAEKIGLAGFATLDTYVQLHEGFIKAYNEKNYKLCEDALEHLMGQFGGELDTFYEEISKRISNN